MLESGPRRATTKITPSIRPRPGRSMTKPIEGMTIMKTLNMIRAAALAIPLGLASVAAQADDIVDTAVEAGGGT